jgi:anaerobic magnesium-protoporphyrin IX monomethyl ester cyclase
MKALLILPPHWLPIMPHLALPTLTAHLRAYGMDVEQLDLNVETFDALLTRPSLDEALARAHARPPRTLPPSVFAKVVEQAPQLIGQVEPAKAVLRDARFYDGRTSRQAFLTLVRGLELASLPFHPASIQFTTFIPPAPEDSSAALFDVIADPARNPYTALFRTSFLPRIVAAQPDLIGISIPTLGQMLGAMTLAYLIKEAGLPCHITVGGPHVSMLREQLPHTPQLFDLFDSAVVISGEGALLRLAEVLDGEGGLAADLSKVPNLIYRDRGTIRNTELQAMPEPRLGDRPNFGAPDFGGLPLSSYLTPAPVLPLLTSHGCYHGKCAFCNVGYGGPDRFHPLDPEMVVEQMQFLHGKYGARHFFFADEALTPRTLRTLADRLASADPALHWCGCARFDPGLTPDLLNAISRGGCRMLLFGLETAAEATIKRMHKQTQPETMSRILRDSAKAGIWNHTFFFFGFPGETMDAAQETVNFVYAHQDAIHSASPGAFLLERYAPAERNPNAYGITRVVEDRKRDLAIYFDYEVASGLNEAMAEHLVSRLVDVLPEKVYGQYYITDVYRLLYASYLWENGQPMPLWLA